MSKEDQKELNKVTCSIICCKKKSTGFFESKPYCQYCYDKVNPRTKRFRYANGPVYY